MPMQGSALFPEKTPGGFRTGVFFGNETTPAVFPVRCAVVRHSLAQEMQFGLRR